MVAASNNYPDVIVILLLFALDHTSTLQYDKGMWTRDHEDLTAAHIAVKYGSLECLSVLLYLHPKYAESLDDFSCHLSLADIASIPHLRSAEIQKFLNAHYPSMVASTTAINRQQKTSEKKLVYILKLAMKLITSIPKALVFSSLRISFLFTVYFMCERFKSLNFIDTVLHIMSIVSIAFLWLLYSTLCTHSPGTYSIKSLAEKNQYQNHIAEVSGIGKSYDDALQLLYKSSSIPKKSKNRTLDHGSDDSDFLSANICCHYCRIYKPIRSKHSKTLERCVPTYDHYCVFLENHVGRDNYIYYISSLAAATMIVLPLLIHNIYCYLLQKSAVTDNMGNNGSSLLSHSRIFEFVTFLFGENNATSSYSNLSAVTEKFNYYLQRSIGYFSIWCCLWWFAFTMLLSFHVAIMCLNLTTREFIHRSEKSWSDIWKRNEFSRKSILQNIYDRLFPEDDDICHTRKDVVNLLLRPPNVRMT